MSTMFYIWMAVAVIFLIIELMTPTMIFICFVAGAIGAGLLAANNPESFLWQLAVFVVVSLGLLPFTRKLAKKISKDPPEKSNVDRMIGQVALVTQEIDPDLGGKVKFEGEVWVAKADERIAADTKVKIVQISGTKVVVEKME